MIIVTEKIFIVKIKKGTGFAFIPAGNGGSKVELTPEEIEVLKEYVRVGITYWDDLPEIKKTNKYYVRLKNLLKKLETINQK